MCWITSFSSEFFINNRDECLKQIRKASAVNSHGFSLVLAATDSELDSCVRTMNYELFEIALDLASETDGQIFVHLRYATTKAHGLGYTHGFDDFNNTFYMHNGIIDNKSGMNVDSFNIAVDVNCLKKEDYANVFLIDLENREYRVIRKKTNTLYTDHDGNFATTPIAAINQPVKEYSEHLYMLPLEFDYVDEYAEEYTDFLDYADQQSELEPFIDFKKTVNFK